MTPKTLIDWATDYFGLICLVATSAVVWGADLHATEFQITQISDINPTGDSNPIVIGELNGRLIFSATEGNYFFRQLFSTDGTNVDKIPAEIGGAVVFDTGARHVNVNGNLFFPASGKNGAGLFKTDGETITELEVLQLARQDYDVVIPPMLVPFQNRIYFPANGVNGWELYHSDGVTVGNFDINSTGDSFPMAFHGYNGELYFRAIGDTGERLFKTNGSTLVEFDVIPGSNTTGQFKEFKDELYFQAKGQSGRELFKTNGSTFTELDVSPGDSRPDSFFVFGNELFFKARSASGFEEVYRTDGHNVARFPMPFQDQSDSGFLTVFKGQLYLVGRGTGGRTVFRTNGASLNEVMRIATASSISRVIGEYQDELYLEANSLVDGQFKRGLFKTDGTSVVFIDPNQGSSYVPQNVSFFRDSIFFTTLGPNGVELFEIVGDSLVEFDINPAGNSDPSGFVVIDDRMFFSALGEAGRELYYTDGSSLHLIDINPNGDSNPGPVFKFRNELFVMAEAMDGAELFKLTPTVPEPDWISLVISLAVATCHLRHRHGS